LCRDWLQKLSASENRNQCFFSNRLARQFLDTAANDDRYIVPLFQTRVEMAQRLSHQPFATIALNGIPHSLASNNGITVVTDILGLQPNSRN
jgi:hypothetical protein